MTVTEPAGAVTEQWLRSTGHRLAANERARTMRTARIRLGRLLEAGHEHGGDGWVCPGEYGANGWQPHCRGAA